MTDRKCIGTFSVTRFVALFAEPAVSLSIRTVSLQPLHLSCVRVLFLPIKHG